METSKGRWDLSTTDFDSLRESNPAAQDDKAFADG